MENEGNIYHGKDGRLRIYVKDTGKTISYPKYLMEKELGRTLLPKEHVHHIDIMYAGVLERYRGQF